jgi:hypothetical protein
MDGVRNQREAIVLKIRTVRKGAAQLSQLLADGVLSDAEWEGVGRLLTSCRQERRRLEERLRNIEG